MSDGTIKVNNQIEIVIGDQVLHLTRSQAESLRDQLLAEFPITPSLPPFGLAPFNPNTYPWGQPNQPGDGVYPLNVPGVWQPNIIYHWTTTSPYTTSVGVGGQGSVTSLTPDQNSKLS